MSDKHKNKQDMWKFEDILGTLGLTEQDYKLLVLELKRCKIMNQTVKRIFDATDNKKREAVRQLTAYIGQQNPDIYNLEEKVEGSAEVSFDKPIDPEELKKRMNSSYNAVKSDMELSNRGLRSYVGEKTKIMAFEREMEQAKSDLPHEINIHAIGNALLSSDKYGYILPFEAVSILLLACIIGGIIIARKR